MNGAFPWPGFRRRVQQVGDYVEPEELRLMATWLELERVEVTGRGELGPRLR
jgi:uncharacterized protein YcaQ